MTPTPSGPPPERVPAEYLYPERTHDYDPSWDYRRDRRPDPALRAAAEAAAAELTRNLLPRLGVFAGFDLHFATGLRGDLGRYVSGTVSRPMVVLSLPAIRAACEKYGLPYALGVETTITHELAHAVQESRGLTPDEAEAERFARAWWERREVAQFRGDPPAETPGPPDGADAPGSTHASSAASRQSRGSRGR